MADLIEKILHRLKKEKGRKYLGVTEFAEAVEKIIASLNIRQERETVSAVPDERTIRYYLAQGLIEPPDEKEGTKSVFGYIHLLQLAAVKVLQAEHLPIRKIQELVPGKSEEELETLLGIGSSSGKKSEAKRYLESLLTASAAKTFMSAPNFVMQPQASRGPTSSEWAELPLSSLPACETQSWQRVEIQPGLEFHIRSDFKVPTTSVGIRSLEERIRRTLNFFGKTSSKERT